MMMEEATATLPPQPHQSAEPSKGRRDLYAGIHKALRLFMAETLGRLGSTDAGDAEELQGALQMLERLLGLCELHIKDENDFVHPALERAEPGAAARIAAEHAHHLEGIADLRELASIVTLSGAGHRAESLGRLYRALALFVAENFQHMHVEETAHNAALWSTYSDAELIAIEQALVASIPPAAMFEALHWFLPALSAPERTGMLLEMRQGGMPDEPFQAVLGIAQRRLTPPQHRRLMESLGLGTMVV